MTIHEKTWDNERLSEVMFANDTNVNTFNARDWKETVGTIQVELFEVESYIEGEGYCLITNIEKSQSSFHHCEVFR